MNNIKDWTSLPEILSLLEAISAALRAQDEARSSSLMTRALDLLKSRSLDLCDRMTVRIVLGRIRRMGGHRMAHALESSLA